MNSIPYRLSSRNSFSSSLRSSHILSIKITNHLSLVASLLAPSHHPSARYSQDYPLDVPSPLLLGGAMILSIIGVGTLFTSLTATTASSALEQAGTAAVVAINIPVR